MLTGRLPMRNDNYHRPTFLEYYAQLPEMRTNGANRQALDDRNTS